jgi:hypothetical protein
VVLENLSTYIDLRTNEGLINTLEDL